MRAPRPAGDLLLPNLFVIGAPKCGTTSLHHYLGQHPEISMSRTKEPFVFDSDDWESRLECYRGEFDAGTSWRGESTTSYATYPVDGDVAARIAAAVPQARLVYLVGDPIERLVSHYLQRVSSREEARSLDEVLRDYANPRNTYVTTSRYSLQLDRYLARFPRSSLLVIEQSELRLARADTLRETFSFLGVDPGFSSPRFRDELGSSEDRVRLGGAAARLRDSRLAAALRESRPQLHGPLARAGRRLLGRRLRRPPIDPGLRAEVADFLREDAARLRRLTGKRLEHWEV
jgi:hypothetical protein